MKTSAEALLAIMSQFTGRSAARHVAGDIPYFMWSGGVQKVAKEVNAHWLIQVAGGEFAPVYLDAWDAGKGSVGILNLTVTNSAQGNIGQLTLCLEGSTPPAFDRKVDPMGFPEGSWNFYLGVEPVGINDFIVCMYLPQEH